MVTDLYCRYCGLPWPGDKSLSLNDLINGAKPDLPICIKAPPAKRWMVDSGINGHIFNATNPVSRIP